MILPRPKNRDFISMSYANNSYFKEQKLKVFITGFSVL